ncbi:MAG TPA: hypothetical protein VM537_24195 [Anaerolineae bacterium]|nr:hypothetical protein [Anaerolineae bacterium]
MSDEKDRLIGELLRVGNALYDQGVQDHKDDLDETPIDPPPTRPTPDPTTPTRPDDTSGRGEPGKPTRPDPAPPSGPPSSTPSISIVATVWGEEYEAHNDTGNWWRFYNDTDDLAQSPILGAHIYRKEVARGVTEYAIRISNAAVMPDGSGAQGPVAVDAIRISVSAPFTIVPEVMGAQESEAIVVHDDGTASEWRYDLGRGPIPPRCAFIRRFHVVAEGAEIPPIADQYERFYGGGLGVRGDAIPDLNDDRISNTYRDGPYSGWGLADKKGADLWREMSEAWQQGQHTTGYFQFDPNDKKIGYEHGGRRIETCDWNFTTGGLRAEKRFHRATASRMDVYMFHAETGEVITPEMIAAAHGGKFPFQCVADDGSHKKRGTGVPWWDALLPIGTWSGERQGEVNDILSWMPHDAQHAGRSILAARRLWYALEDECARDDLLMYAAHYRMGFTQLETDTSGWSWKRKNPAGEWQPVDKTLYGRNKISDTLNYETETGSGRDLAWVCEVQVTAQQVLWDEDRLPEFDRLTEWTFAFRVWYDRVTALDGILQRRGAPTSMNPAPEQFGMPEGSKVSQAHEEALVGVTVEALGIHHDKALTAYIVANKVAGGKSWPPRKWLCVGPGHGQLTAITIADDTRVGAQSDHWRARCRPDDPYFDEAWLQSVCRPQDWNSNLNHVAFKVAEILR